MNKTLTPVSAGMIEALECRGCTAEDWSRVCIAPESEPQLFSNVDFEGDVCIGVVGRSLRPDACIRNATLKDCIIGDSPRIRNVHGSITNMNIGNNVTIENVGRIECEPHAGCGVGMEINVLDETGTRPVIAYIGLTAQSAILMARSPRSVAEELYNQTLEYLPMRPAKASIGDSARITDTQIISNVEIGRECIIEGAARLSNGTIANNANPGKGLAYIGPGVDADGFIIEDGVVDAGALIRHTFVGQGVRLEKYFTSHDSLFFANCSMENGEACALFAGPYTVSMHKGTLLIGCQTSFMNAGSSTNQSNHMYKLGPVHWGVLERGVKTSSNSYLMLGANIGAFSLLMGDHKTHPDSREFPFSYLFGDASGATVVVPAVMLRSCGLMRDEKKWPTRDRRRRRGMPLRDRVIFDVLNPCTVEAMLSAIDTIRELMHRPADDDRYIRYKGMKLSRASLERAIKLYTLGVKKYLTGILLPDTPAEDENGWVFPSAPADENLRAQWAEPWIDLAGQPMPRRYLTAAIETTGVTQREEIFDEAMERYDTLQQEWISARIPDELRLSAEELRRGAAEFDTLVETDRETYRNNLSAELAMLGLY
ncbi:MAG: DUF4954 family protein [Muribaculaceae bacterium]|nr:DUF4954 family protein [Muribaculaceae bacterium]